MQLPIPPIVDSDPSGLNHTHKEDFQALTQAVHAAYTALERIQSACPTQMMLESMGYTGTCTEVPHPHGRVNDELVKVVVFHQAGYHVTFGSTPNINPIIPAPQPRCEEDAISICSERSAISLSTDWEAEYNIRLNNDHTDYIAPDTSPEILGKGKGPVFPLDDHVVPPSSPFHDPVDHNDEAPSTTESWWYSVTVGRRPGVFHGLETIQENVMGIKGQSHHRFPTKALAEADYDKFLDAGLVKQISMQVVKRTLTR